MIGGLLLITEYRPLITCHRSATTDYLFLKMPLESSYDRLQPCLLDRLIDDHPDRKEEGRSNRSISIQRYREGVFRDLDWLLNAVGHYPDEPVGDFTFQDFIGPYRSVLNYGLRQFYGRIDPSAAEIENELTQALLAFEPRIIRGTLKVSVSIDRQMLAIEIQGVLWIDPMPEQIVLKTEIDLESGISSHG